MTISDHDAFRARNFRIVRTVPTDLVFVKKLHPDAAVPTYGSDGAAGMDLYALIGTSEFIVPPGERRLIKTGIAIAIPRGHYARVAPRSGLALKHGIDVMAGVIDEDYRGEVGVILMNLGAETFSVRHNDRIAQLIIEKYTPCLTVEVDDLDATERGSGGFGSTGK